MNNYYLYLKNSIYSDFFDITKMYVTNNSYIKKYKCTLNYKLYKALKNYLINNNYLINIDTLFDTLKPLKLSYKSINEVEETIRNIDISINYELITDGILRGFSSGFEHFCSN